MGVYAYNARTIRGEEKSLGDYAGQVLLIVNTASKCGFTPQYAELQKLYEANKDKGLVVLGFPCNQFGAQEPGTNEDIHTFCQLNYGVSFPLFDKIEVLGEHKHPLFAYLTEQAPFEGFDPDHPAGKMLASMLQQHGLLEGNDIKWNFTKFLIDREGNVVRRFESPVEPAQMQEAIDALL
ncbi:glutathione peroxidase [Paenibacillus sp. UNCCL117]|uniref:glutathione peroxidase n=1 Tax=unclassified Paenibacillus TaxID=185978 RepID=UPI00088ADC40|nr:MULTISPECIES: glutathione peroxidase [unclassified Paenibacillus]SDC67130.1 glutathione peroxidase [Paenibacillus sp. cl123]SFW23229.1 glutathione peroxidase [Paenibacillus sp. UNCCL117]